jgi:ADP-ribose pyrophosphatase YjhB (NUDIX family)
MGYFRPWMADPIAPYDVRLAARVVLLAPTGRILLLRHRGPRAPFWATPGGGLDPGESFPDAARRELREETGLDLPLGPCIWEDRFDLQGTARIQLQRFFLARAPAEDLPQGVDRNHALEGISAARWWSVDELATSLDEIYPRRLPELLARLAAEGPPREAVVLG